MRVPLRDGLWGEDTPYSPTLVDGVGGLAGSSNSKQLGPGEMAAAVMISSVNAAGGRGIQPHLALCSHPEEQGQPALVPPMSQCPR